MGLVLIANQYIDTKHSYSFEDTVNITFFDTELYITVLMSLSVLFIAFVFLIVTSYVRCVKKAPHESPQKDKAMVKKRRRKPLWKRLRSSLPRSLKCGKKVAINNQIPAEPDEDHDPLREEHSIVYLIGSVYIFGIGSIVLAISEIGYFFHRGSDPSKGSSSQHKNYKIHLFFFLIMLLFTVSQMLFLTLVCFWKKSLSKVRRNTGDTTVKFFLVHLLATNIVLAIFFVAKESGVFLGGSEKSSDDVENLTCFGTDENQPHVRLEDKEEYLELFVVEYILIVAGLLYSLLRHISNRRHRRKTVEILKHKPYSSGISVHPSSEHVQSEERSALDLKGTSKATDKSAKVISLYRLAKLHQLKAYFLPVIGVVLVVVMIENASNLKDRYHYSGVLTTDYSLKIIVYLSEILALYFILAQVSSLEYTSRKMEAKLLLFSMSLGIIPSDLFALIAAIAGTKEKEIIVDGLPKFKPLIPSILMLVFCIMNIFSVCFVTYAIIVTQRYRCKTTAWFRALILYLFVTNIGHWIKDAFTELKHDGTTTYSIVQQFYQDFAWQLINRSIYPLCIFFRFHAAAMLVSILFKFASWRGSCLQRGQSDDFAVKTV